MHVLLALAIVAVGGDEAAPVSNAVPAPQQLEARRVAGPSAATGPMISYEIRYVTLSDSDWRGKFDPQLKSVARQGGAAVWAADALTTRELLTYWGTNSSTNILQAPKAVTPSGGEVRFVNEQQIHYVAHLERVADGPVNKATKVAFKPEIDQVHDGIRARLSSGRVEDQGLRALIRIDSDRLQAFETSKYSEKGASAVIQVPVVESARVDGEWVIPKDGALIVSLGAGKSKGKIIREVRPEHLLVLSYRPAPGESPTPVEPRQATSALPKRSKSLTAN